jgi:hypothetical protein
MVSRVRTLGALVAGLLTHPCVAQTAPAEGGVRSGVAADVSSPATEIPGPGPEESATGDARKAFEEGVAALRGERWSEAESSFRRSLTFVRRASAEYDLAFALFKLGRSSESLEVLNGLLKSTRPDEDEEYRELAKSLMVRIVADFPPTRAETTPPEVHSTVESRRREPPARTESSFVGDTAPWITIGIGGALLVSGAVTGILAKKANDEVVRSCPTLERCDESVRDERDRAAALGHATDVLLVTGGVFVVGGVAWRVLMPAGGPTSASNGLFVAATGRF